MKSLILVHVYIYLKNDIFKNFVGFFSHQGQELSGRRGGAGHGGVGGGAPDVAGDSYNSLYQPNQPGSRANPQGGKGGGKVYLNVGSLMFNDGEISVNASASEFGGGSGGSIWIQAYLIEGQSVLFLGFRCFVIYIFL